MQHTHNAQQSTMKSSVGAVTRFNRWFSPSTDHNGDQDPWMDFCQATDDAGDVKMAFDDDFHLTVIPNFLHDSDAYVANLEDRLERLEQVNLNPSPREILAAMIQARTLRMKNAELNPELNAKPADDAGEGDDAGLMAMWPALFALVSRRFFPRLALTKEETQHLVKYDYLLTQYQDEVNNNNVKNEVDGDEIREVDTVPDMSWERRNRDGSNEQSPDSPPDENSYLHFDSPEAHEIRTPKNWTCDEAHQEIQHDTTPMPEDSANECPKVNRSALSLSAHTNAITQEASTVTSFTPNRHSEEAFYHFAYIKTSMTTTQDSVRVGTPLEYPATAVHADSRSKSKSALQDQAPLTASCNASLTENEYVSSVPDSDGREAKVVSKSSADVSEVTAKEQTVPTTKSSPSLKPTRETEQKEIASPTEEDQVPQYIEEDKGRGQSGGTKPQTQLPTTETEEIRGSNGSSSSQTAASRDSSAHCKALQHMIVPEVTVASSSTRESVIVQQQQRRREEDKRVPVRTGRAICGADITVPEVMVASSSTHESMAAGFEGPWFDKESDTSLGNAAGEDLLQHMSSLVRASVDEDDEPPRVNGNLTSQLSGGCTQLSSTGVCSDGTRSKASEGTSGNYTTNYSDPHSNLFEEDSSVKKDEGQAPIIRMYGHVALQSNLRLWSPQRGIDYSRDSHEAVVAGRLPLPQARRNGAEKTSATTRKDNFPNTKTQDEKGVSPIAWQTAKTKRNHCSEDSQGALKVPVISRTECRKAPSAKSEYWSSSASSVASSTATPRSGTEELPTAKVSASKLSTSSSFKSRQRSVHWFKTIEDVNSDTVVKDCDYLSTSQAKMKVPVKSVTGQCTAKTTSGTSKKPSGNDRSENSRVREACKKFTAHVLEEEGIVASKVYSFPKFFETSGGREQGSERAPEEIVIIDKNENDENGTAVRTVEPSQSLEAQSDEAPSVLATPKDSTVASESEENAAVCIARSSESVEGRNEKPAALRLVESSGAVENDGMNSVVDSAQLSGSLEVPFNEDNSIGSQEHSEDIVETKVQAEDDAEIKVVSRDQFAAVPEGEQSRETVVAKTETSTVDKASQEQDAPPKRVDKETQVTMDGASEQMHVPQARTDSPTVCQRCSPKPPPRLEQEMTQNKAAENEQSSSNAEVLSIKNDCDNNNKSVKPKKDKQEPIEGEERSNDEPCFSKETTVLQCHELVTASHFSRFPASNRNSVPLQRSLNITRTLRITTTNQFKPLNLRHSITGVLSNSSSSFVGRPPPIQSQDSNPRASPPQHHDEGQRGVKEKEDSVTASRLEPVRSVSCRDMAEVTNTQPRQALAHRSHSFHGAASKRTEGLDRVSLENAAHKPAHRTGNGGRADTVPEGVADSRGVQVTSSLSHHTNYTGNSARAEKVAADDGRKEIQLPLKKRMCCRLAQSAELVETQLGLNDESPSGNSMSLQDTEDSTVETAAGSAKDTETEGYDEVTAIRDAVLVIEAALKLGANKDAAFLGEEYQVPGGQIDRTLSLIADSQYSTIGAVEISHVSPISTILGGDTNAGTAKHCASLPCAYECAFSTASKDDAPLNESSVASTVPPEEPGLAVNDGTIASVNAECLKVAVSKPTPLQRQKRGGEKDVDTDGSSCDASVLSEADGVEPRKLESEVAPNDTPDYQCLLAGSFGTFKLRD